TWSVTLRALRGGATASDDLAQDRLLHGAARGAGGGDVAGGGVESGRPLVDHIDGAALPGDMTAA
ncbi:hypothetical protein, partial [Catenulispora subtropica]|uniref:hypothetical protein n=1 Tax=Catenulispora subtropica TaxID=450798 RepID=UPI0031E1579B